MLRVKSPQDFGAAVVFIVIGIAGIVFGRELAFGNTAEMGPGYFPTLLSGLIVTLGLIQGFKSFTIAGPAIEPVQLRPMVFVLIAILVFGVLTPVIGLALTSVIVTLVAALARRGFHWRETLLLGVGLALFAVLVFVYALSQPIPPWWGEP